jgi:hypothetical protein
MPLAYVLAPVIELAPAAGGAASPSPQIGLTGSTGSDQPSAYGVEHAGALVDPALYVPASAAQPATVSPGAEIPPGASNYGNLAATAGSTGQVAGTGSSCPQTLGGITYVPATDSAFGAPAASEPIFLMPVMPIMLIPSGCQAGWTAGTYSSQAASPSAAPRALANFVQTWSNTRIDNAGDQCVAVANQYMTDVLHTPPTNTWQPAPVDTAYHMFDDASSPPWTKIPYSQGQVPQPGDLVIWDQTYGGGDGHVGIVEQVNSNGGFTSFEQNTNGQGSPAESVAHQDYSHVRGWLRYTGEPGA